MFALTIRNLLVAAVVIGAAGFGIKQMSRKANETKAAVYEGKRKAYLKAAGGAYRLPKCCIEHLDAITSDTAMRCLGGITLSAVEAHGAAGTAASPNPVSATQLVTTDWEQKGKDHASIAKNVGDAAVESMFFMAESHFTSHVNEHNTDAFKFWYGFLNHLNRVRGHSDSSHKHLKPLYSRDED